MDPDPEEGESQDAEITLEPVSAGAEVTQPE